MRGGRFTIKVIWHSTIGDSNVIFRPMLKSPLAEFIIIWKDFFYGELQWIMSNARSKAQEYPLPLSLPSSAFLSYHWPQLIDLKFWEGESWVGSRAGSILITGNWESILFGNFFLRFVKWNVHFYYNKLIQYKFARNSGSQLFRGSDPAKWTATAAAAS